MCSYNCRKLTVVVIPIETKFPLELGGSKPKRVVDLVDNV